MIFRDRFLWNLNLDIMINYDHIFTNYHVETIKITLCLWDIENMPLTKEDTRKLAAFLTGEYPDVKLYAVTAGNKVNLNLDEASNCGFEIIEDGYGDYGHADDLIKEIANIGLNSPNLEKIIFITSDKGFARTIVKCSTYIETELISLSKDPISSKLRNAPHRCFTKNDVLN